MAMMVDWELKVSWMLLLCSKVDKVCFPRVAFQATGTASDNIGGRGFLWKNFWRKLVDRSWLLVRLWARANWLNVVIELSLFSIKEVRMHGKQEL